jgi:hypothetical protein
MVPDAGQAQTSSAAAGGALTRAAMTAATAVRIFQRIVHTNLGKLCHPVLRICRVPNPPLPFPGYNTMA